MRPLTWTSWICVSALIVGCSFDQSGLPAPSGDNDASTRGSPDAAIVGCTSNDDCAASPSLCHSAGTCNAAGVCEYPEVDCSQLDGACVVGQCDGSTGACVAAAANDGQVCDAALEGEWSECQTDTSCSTQGQRVRLTSARVCNAGTCTPQAPIEETQSCTIDWLDVEGTPCGPVSCGGFGDCHAIPWSAECSTDGERDRECSGMTCTFLGTCEPSTWVDSTTCSVDTNGDNCWGCWGGGGDCVCDGGMCVPDN